MMDMELLEAIGTLIDKKLELNNEKLEGRIINQVNAIIETKVVPQIQLIAEQYGDILDRLTDTEKLQDVSSRVCALEDIVKTHSQQIEELKIAL